MRNCSQPCATRAGATSKIWASQGPKWFFSKMPSFSSWHIPRHKSLTVVHDLLSFGGCRAIFPYLMLFSSTFSRFVKGTLGSILWAQTPSNWPHHGSSFCQAWPKEYFGLWGGRDRSRQARATVQCKMHDFQHAFDTVALACRPRSHPPQRMKYSLGHAWQKLLPWWGQLEGVWAHKIDPKVPLTNLEKVPENSIK